MKKVVAKKSIKVEHFIKSGGFGSVYKVKYNDEDYALKRFNKPIPKAMYLNILELTKRDFSQEFFAPREVIGYFGRNYLMKYNDAKSMFYHISKKDYVYYLKLVRDLIQKLHKEYELVHGDLHAGNIYFNQYNKTASIIDFDTTAKNNSDISGFWKYFSPCAKEYLKKYGYNYGLDVYIFNLVTLSILTGFDFEQLLTYLNFFDFPFMEENRDLKKLCKELLLDGRKKEYSGEYIIDYF